MSALLHTPETGSYLLKRAGDLLEVTLKLHPPRPGRALFRTNLGHATIQRQETIASTESGEPVLARDWHDLPMQEQEPGLYTISIPLLEVGIFAGKACFFAQGSHLPEWPAGENLQIKVAPAHTAHANTIYTAFVRQFGASLYESNYLAEAAHHERELDQRGYTVIPPSGTFRDLIRQLDTILLDMRFQIVQLLPIHPTPTTYARMGRFGSPFAALDFLSVDPALAEFDKYATPLDQFRELIDAVHARGGRIFMDLPANHTGWASTLQTHHPHWFNRKSDGEFVSPGAWGVTWADLVELDYTDPDLRAYMAEVFLFWCRLGVDGFRCDAGYMIPADTWHYIVARVREEHPDTTFLLEGLGGPPAVTEQLISKSGLDWAYSELFQTEDRGALEWYLPRIIPLAERCGPLIHFAETHDNNRLASRGTLYASMRVGLAAMLSHQGGFGITSGVEWFATEKIVVHGATSLNWGAPHNMVSTLARINTLLATHPAFGPETHLELIQQGKGNTLAILRTPPKGPPLLALINLDCEHSTTIRWQSSLFNSPVTWDLISGTVFTIPSAAELHLNPGQVLCLTSESSDLSALEHALTAPVCEPPPLVERRRNLMALRVRTFMAPANDPALHTQINSTDSPNALGSALASNPRDFCLSLPGGALRCTEWHWPVDTRRQVMLPQNNILLMQAPHPFSVRLSSSTTTLATERAVPLHDGSWALFLAAPPYTASGLDGTRTATHTLTTTAYTPSGAKRKTSQLLVLPPGELARVKSQVDGITVRQNNTLLAVLSNGAGAMAYARAAWGEIRSQYDSLLALNPDPHVPADKIVFWTRCRLWLRHRGYSQTIGAECLDAFEADPAGRFARWHFKVPCGMGQWVPISLELTLQPNHNRATLQITRQHNTNDSGPEEEITIIARPDIEWRSFHTKTKAFTGPEREWPTATHSDSSGFAFTPDPNLRVAMLCSSGTFTYEPQWAYMVPHPEEQIRGLGPNSDLYSPGWFSLSLRAGQSTSISAGTPATTSPDNSNTPLTFTEGTNAPPQLLTIPDAMQQALALYIVRRDSLKTVIAGYPWFLDWGRDTLIVMRGLIAAGYIQESFEILREFGRYEEHGTLPNIIHGQTVGNRDTSDAPLWFCVAAGDLMQAMGDKQVLNAPCGNRKLHEVITSILTHYQHGTPNGIKMDPESALVYSPSHFTWMDTNYPAATPRQGYPVEIQALWIAALRLAAAKINPQWLELADRAADSLMRYYPVHEGWLADSLRASPDTPAANATPEDTLRSNQLMVITLGSGIPRQSALAITRACESLLVPGAIRSLADRPVTADMGVWDHGKLLNDPHHPYQGRYQGDEDTRRKPAYHNGTAWTWPFPHYAESLLILHGKAAIPQALSLLGSSVELVNTGVLCHPPEICDGDAPHTHRGCLAQAWGASELLRVWQLATKLQQSDNTPIKRSK